MKVKTKENKPPAVKVVTAPEPEGDLQHVPLDHLVDHDELEYRHIKPDHVAELKASLRRSGLDTPLSAWNGGDPEIRMEFDGVKGVFPASFLVAGQHRREALRELAKEEATWFAKTFPNGIPVIMRTGDLKDTLLAQIRENAARDNPEPHEILPQVKRLQESFGMKASEIAKGVGRSKTWISRVLDIENVLGPKALKKVIAGEIGFSDAIEAAAQTKRDEKSGKTVDKVGTVKQLVQKGKIKKKANKKRAAKRMGAKAVYAAYNALPNLVIGKKLKIAEAALEYLAGESEELPSQLQPEEEE